MTTRTLELDEVIRRYAWALLKQKVNFFRRWFLDEEDYVCEVDWSALSMEHKMARFKSREEDNSPIETNWGKVVTGSKWVPLWSCDFENKSNSKQTHTFRGSRDTTTWLDVDLEQCYTIKKEVNVDMNIPPTLSKIRAGRDSTCNLNQIKGQVFKEVLTWEVNSQVEVLPQWSARAELLAKEECHSMEFEVRTTIYNPTGILPVYFKRKSDGRTVYLIELENFDNAFKAFEDGVGLTPEEKECVEIMIERTLSPSGDETTSACHLQLITKGTCISLSWGDQKVDINTSPMSPRTVDLVDGYDERQAYTHAQAHAPAPLTIINKGSVRGTRSWRGGSDGHSPHSSLDSNEITLTSHNINGTVVSEFMDRQFIIKSKEASHA